MKKIFDKLPQFIAVRSIKLTHLYLRDKLEFMIKAGVDGVTAEKLEDQLLSMLNGEEIDAVGSFMKPDVLDRSQQQGG